MKVPGQAQHSTLQAYDSESIQQTRSDGADGRRMARGRPSKRNQTQSQESRTSPSMLRSLRIQAA